MDNSEKKKQQNKNNRTRGNQVCVHFYAKYSFLCVCEQQSAHLCLASKLSGVYKYFNLKNSYVLLEQFL